MRVLLLSDTHGRLDIINDLALRTRCGAVIHAGDFGFYDTESHGHLSHRELKLQIVHSELSEHQKIEWMQAPADQQWEFVQRHLALSDLPQYLTGDKEFAVPVYAVWGNHEDVEVVKKFSTGDYAVKNLAVLGEKTSYHLDGIHIYGVGGNCLHGNKLLQQPIAGGGGRVWTTLSQYTQLMDTVQENAWDEELRLMVSHVSPGKEPLVKLMGIRTRANLIMSGHMASPMPLTWNDFAVSSPETARKEICDCVDKLKDLLAECDSGREAGLCNALQRIIDYSEEEIVMGRGQKAPRWYRDMYYLNLPDAQVGYAILEIEGKRMHLETFAETGS